MPRQVQLQVIRYIHICHGSMYMKCSYNLCKDLLIFGNLTLHFLEKKIECTKRNVFTIPTPGQVQLQVIRYIHMCHGSMHMKRSYNLCKDLLIFGNLTLHFCLRIFSFTIKKTKKKIYNK
jgi:hypothetical protein